MKRWCWQIFLILLCFVFVSSCRPGKRSSGTDNRSKTYPCYQGLKTDVAWIVLEWNGKPVYGGYGSGFLVDKEKGAFFTNKHVSDVFNSLGKGSHKVFFNCKVYNAEIIQTAPLADAALVRITDSFSSSSFPDPAPFAKEKVRVGDKIVVEGYHPHPYFVRMADNEEGYKFPLIPIFKDYYNLGTRDLEKEKEIVFETLEAMVVAVNKKIPIGGQGSGIVQDLREDINVYIEIKTAKDHRFPFGGLSGTVARNRKGETIGIFTAGPTYELEYKMAFLTPAELVENLKSFLNKP